ncbi:caspase family protein [Paractinoplanes hotanensis]|uniref:Caspase family protein n=1 Tax=Paractinoplanes hotanensis TaxID=2906497 RepID=A0ABT0XV43_9ACTN|nr:caspase family protein [Actinoplanes hotanensis]MCM4077480.1 caspase family protein [Actinoplanes hotanensis]
MTARRALVLGCCTFKDESLAKLRSPRRDVHDLGRVLTDQRYTVKTEIDCSSRTAQREIEGFFQAASVTDTLNLLYLSCHGVQDRQGQLYFAFTDTECDYLGSTAISAEWVRERMQSSRSKATVVLVDCCFSGAFIKGMSMRSPGPGVEALVRDLPRSSGVAVLTASGATEGSFEDQGGDRPSYFTAAVVDGISTGAADLNGDGRITVDELYEYVYAQMSRGPSPQRPRHLGAGEGALVIAETLADPQPVTAVGRWAAMRPRRRRRSTIAAVTLAGLLVSGAALAVPHLPDRTPERTGEVPPPTPLAVASNSGPPVSASTSGTPSTPPSPTPVISTSVPRTSAPGQPRQRATTARTTTTPPAVPKAQVVSTGTISSPAGGSPVKNCSYFTGTAKLANGRTLILASRNLSNGDPNRYVQQVFGWREPGNLASWRGHQYFPGDNGQRYEVELMSVDLDAVQTAYDGSDAEWDALAGRGTRLAAREVVRATGTVANDCEGP